MSLWRSRLHRLLPAGQHRGPAATAGAAGAAERLAGQLQSELGPFGYLWLGACAVYPQTLFPLTVYLGRRLAESLGRGLPDEDEHLALCRLPWFRDGRMPDPVRIAILTRLDAAERSLVRRIVEEALFSLRTSVRADPEMPYLELATPEQSWRRWLRSQLSRRARSQLGEDRIFARFLLGLPVTPPMIALDHRLARLFGARLAGWLDGWTLAVAAACALAWVGIDRAIVPELDRAAPARTIPIRTEITLIQDCSVCPELVVVPPGEYLMGSPPEEEGRHDSEGPQHMVRITDPLAVGRYEVTRGEFAAFVQATGYRIEPECWTYEQERWEWRRDRSFQNPGFDQTDDHPVVCVSWHDAQAYATWLGERTGAAYRLLSEAEWEYAARAGTATAYWWGDGSADICRYANLADSSTAFNWRVDCGDGHARTAPVGVYLASGFGLHDTAGNVWEWVEDCWNDNYNGAPTDGRTWTHKNCEIRVQRGGSWLSNPRNVRSAYRNRDTPGNRLSLVGFRLARTLSLEP